MLRLPDGLRDEIADLAKASGRSMNAEIVFRLRHSILQTRQGDIDVSPELTSILAGLSKEDLEQFVELISKTSRLLSKVNPKR
jgi:hypothetical protein